MVHLELVGKASLKFREALFAYLDELVEFMICIKIQTC